MVGEPRVSPIDSLETNVMPGGASVQRLPWVAVPHLQWDHAPLRPPPAPLGLLRLSLAPRYRACFLPFVVSPIGLMIWAKPPDHARAFGHPVPQSGNLCTENRGFFEVPELSCADMPRS